VSRRHQSRIRGSLRSSRRARGGARRVRRDSADAQPDRERGGGRSREARSAATHHGRWTAASVGLRFAARLRPGAA